MFSRIHAYAALLSILSARAFVPTPCTKLGAAPTRGSASGSGMHRWAMSEQVPEVDEVRC
eukprot:scaffold4283_cov220-Pinguiococcus_pyrenoidosus.AAC.2